MSDARPWTRDTAIAAAAAAELVSREKHYPAMIANGEITRPLAVEDVDSWRAIAELFDRGTIDHGLTWTDLIIAAERALESRREALRAKPADAYLTARLASVQTIHAQLCRSSYFARYEFQVAA